MVSQTDAAAAPKSLPKQMLIFALPIMAMNILQLLFNAADMVVVGRFSGSEALAAVGATGALINLIVNLFMGLSVGTTVVLANDYGAQRYDDIKLTVHTSMAVSMISGLIVMGIGLAFCVPLLRMMGTPEDIITGSALYMRIFFLGLPGSMVYNFGAAVMRAVGDSRRPTYFLTIAGVANVILNLFFVAGLRMGVAGVAWATVISQYAAMGLTLLSLIRRDGPIRFIPRLMTIDRRKLLGIVRIGLPAGLQGVLFSISNVLIQSAVNSFGSVVVAASAAAGNVEGFVAQPATPSQCRPHLHRPRMGAEDYDGIDTIARFAPVCVPELACGGRSDHLFRPDPLGFYTTNPEVIAVGMERMRVLMAVYFTCGTMNVFPGITRAMGYSVLPMLCTLVGACLMRIVWLVTFFAWMPTITMLFLCYPVTWTLAGLGQVAVFFYARKQVRKRAAAVSGITPAAPAAVR